MLSAFLSKLCKIAITSQLAEDRVYSTHVQSGSDPVFIGELFPRGYSSDVETNKFALSTKRLESALKEQSLKETVKPFGFLQTKNFVQQAILWKKSLTDSKFILQTEFGSITIMSDRIIKSYF